MCGITGIVGNNCSRGQIEAMVCCQRHRGPDAEGFYSDPNGLFALGHNRLSIIDLSQAGRQPMSDHSGRYLLVFNGELYNYLELRAELAGDYSFKTRTDTEVLLAAWHKWEERCLEKLIGMFAFLLWDQKTHTLFAVRDRFGVKPLYFHRTSQGGLLLASEIKSLHAAGIPARPDHTTWATYLASGLYDHSERTFWENIEALPAGCLLKWHDGRTNISRWYDLVERVMEFDSRPLKDVREEYVSLLKDSVRLRFRADVPVGINLSGGLDSSTLLGLVQSIQGDDSDVKAFTFVTGDPNYDESEWVDQMLAHTQHPSIKCEIRPDEVPALAESVQAAQDEPFGGLPTLCYARLFELARSEGVIVLLDGQGMDEQWAGYDYYVATLSGEQVGTVQGTKDSPVRPNCLTKEFRALAERPRHSKPFTDELRNTQYRDTCYTKIPRALRFNDRVSMRSSTELREPFLDHRLFELAFKQPAERKIVNGTQKWLLRDIASELLPTGVVEAPKRPLQTPQREWLRGPLREWATDLIDTSLQHFGGEWLCSDTVNAEWQKFIRGESDNSFYVWQWLSLGLSCRASKSDNLSADDYRLVGIA